MSATACTIARAPFTALSVLNHSVNDESDYQNKHRCHYNCSYVFFHSQDLLMKFFFTT